ncbi:MAG: cytochrome c biogenesis protein CcsA [Gammaproteobacteria bacterium]|nr:cytochrome c biogenesis protein CcsA [Gammaproteobacteria bacterium]
MALSRCYATIHDMISLLVSELLFVAAALLAARALKSGLPTTAVQLLSACAVGAGLLYWQTHLAGAHGAVVSMAGSGMITAALALIVALFKPMPIALVLVNAAAAAFLLPLFMVSVPTTSTGISGSAALHVVLAVLGFSAFTLAALQALSVVWLSKQIKQHRLGDFSGAGSLEANESSWVFLTYFAWVAVLLAILSGVPSVTDAVEQNVAHKIFFAVLAWILLTVVLAGRRLRGWRDKTAASWVLVGWAALILAWFGVKLVLEQLV